MVKFKAFIKKYEMTIGLAMIVVGVNRIIDSQRVVSVNLDRSAAKIRVTCKNGKVDIWNLPNSPEV